MAIPVPSQIPTPDPGYPVIGPRRRVVLIGPGDSSSPHPPSVSKLVRLLRKAHAGLTRAPG